MTQVSSLLISFKTKIEEAVGLVPNMPANEKLKAVQFWNVVSEKLQEIVNNSAADISALAPEQLEKDNTAKMLGTTLDKPSEQTLHNNSNTAAAEQLTNDSTLTDQAVPPTLTEQQLMTEAGIKLTDSDLHDAVLYRSVTLQQQLLKQPQKPNEIDTSVSLLATAASLPTVPSTTLTLMPPTITPQNAHLGNTLLAPSSTSLTDIQTTSTSVLAAALTVPSVPPPESITTTVNELTTTCSLPPELTSLPCVPSPTDSVPKLESASKRNRGRPSGPVKCDKNGDSDWSPLEEGLTRSNRRAGSDTRDNIRQSARKVRRNFTLTDVNDIEDEEEESDADIDADGVMLPDDEDDEEEEEEEEGEEEEDDEKEENDDKCTNDTLLDRGTTQDEDAENKQDKIDKNNKSDSRLKRNRKRRADASEGFAADGGEYTCEFCNRKFPNISSLTTHRWIHTKPYACTECSARFSTKGNLIVHKRRHTGEKPYNCNQCDARFSTKGNLKRHVKTHSGEKPWECTQCGGRFTEKKSLKVHMRRHTGEKPYQCKVCGKRFAQTGILQTHMAMHMDQKAHLCDHCGKSFRQKSQLRLHMMRHEGVRKYQCISCPARFLTKGDLERHNRIHTGERPFICELCGKTFTRQQSLNEHMNRHYGLKPYECKYCGRNFAEMSACYKHIKQHERSQLPTMQHHVTVDAADGQKFTVLVHTDQPLDVGSEISVVQQDQNAVIPSDSHITVAVTDQIGDFAAINLLASASTYQQNY